MRAATDVSESTLFSDLQQGVSHYTVKHEIFHDKASICHFFSYFFLHFTLYLFLTIHVVFCYFIFVSVYFIYLVIHIVLHTCRHIVHFNKYFKHYLYSLILFHSFISIRFRKVFSSGYSAKTKLLIQEKHVRTKWSQIRLLLLGQSNLGLFVCFLK